MLIDFRPNTFRGILKFVYKFNTFLQSFWVGRVFSDQLTRIPSSIKNPKSSSLVETNEIQEKQRSRPELPNLPVYEGKLIRNDLFQLPC